MDRLQRSDVAVSIAAVRARAPYAEALAAAIPGARIVWDDPPSGSSWPSYRRILAAAGDRGETWTVSLDDDALLCDAFPAVLAAALAACPGDFAGFYAGSAPLMRRAQRAGAAWGASVQLVHGIGWAIRTSLAAGAAALIDHCVRPEFPSGDARLRLWLAAHGRWNFVTVPNLIDHRPELSSVRLQYAGQSNRRRRAAAFDRAPGVDRWTDRVVYGPSTHAQIVRTFAASGALRKQGLETLRILADRESTIPGAASLPG